MDSEDERVDGLGLGAGTGKIKVRTARKDSVISANSLYVEYSIANYSRNDKPDSEPICRVYLARLFDCADMVFTLHNTFRSNAKARDAVVVALNKWSELLNIKLELEKNSSNEYVYVADFMDNSRNIIGFSSSANGVPYKSGILMAAETGQVFVGIGAEDQNLDCHTYFRGNGSNIYINNSSQISWDYRTSGSVSYNSTSFYETMLHEIGHLLNKINSCSCSVCSFNGYLLSFVIP